MTSYFRIKIESAPKTSLNAKGSITYAVLRDAERKDVYLCLLGNDGGGYFSQEAVPFAAIKQCLEGINTERPIPAKTFKAAFRGRSANNSGFAVTALRHLKLLQPAPDAPHQHVLGNNNWDDWRRAMLAETGEPFELPEVTKSKAKTVATVPETQPSEHIKTKQQRSKSPVAKRDLSAAATEGGDDDCPT